jgi:hypothetical protein
MIARSKYENILMLATAGIIIFISKILLINFYGNATPYWDQWDAEAAYLYKPWLEGTLNIKDLFSAHNEHRIFTTRVIGLLLLTAKGYWDPIFQMQINGIIHVLAITTLLYYLIKELNNEKKLIIIGFTTLLMMIPFGWENTLAGFQSQFYILLLTTFIFIWAMSNYPTFSKAWNYGYLIGFLSVITLASGAITLLAGGFVLIIRRYLFKEAESVKLVAIGLVFGLGLLAIYMTPTIPHHAPLKADSLYSFVRAVGAILAWPILHYGLGLFVIQVPLLLLTGRILFNRKKPTAATIFILGMSIWVFGQILSIAYGRAAGPLSSRYVDIFSIALILNASALVILIEKINYCLIRK